METAALTIAIVATIAATMAAWIAFHSYRAQTDPDVIVYLEHDDKRPSLLVLVIENIGSGVAYDIGFKIPKGFPDDPIGIEASGRTDFTPMSSGPLISGIKSLPPKGKRMMNWGQYGGVYDYMGDDHLPIEVRFKRKNLLGIDDHTFNTTSYIDVSSFAHTDASRRSEAAHLSSIATTLKDVKKEFVKLNSKIQSIESRLENDAD